MGNPTGYHGAESVAEHPYGPKGNAHQIMFGGDLTAKHNKIKETEILRIVVLAQKSRKHILFAKNGQCSERIIQLEPGYMLLGEFLAD